MLTRFDPDVEGGSLELKALLENAGFDVETSKGILESFARSSRIVRRMQREASVQSPEDKTEEIKG
jgi:hypothetical protein